MESFVQLCAMLDAAPSALVGWLHILVRTYGEALPWPSTLLVGPHTFQGEAPTAFETVAIYWVDKRKPHDIGARRPVLALTYLPLCQLGIGLDLRVWPLFPAALDTLKYDFFDHFTQANPVLSSVASLHFFPGAPPLACNRWLQEQLRSPVIASAQAKKYLYAAWLEQYRALKGDYPADRRRGFRAIVAHTRRHVPKNRSE